MRAQQGADAPRSPEVLSFCFSCRPPRRFGHCPGRDDPQPGGGTMLKALKQAAGKVASTAGSLKDAGVSAARAAAAELNAARPLFPQIGYRVSKVEVVLALMPKVSFSLRRIASVDDAAFERLLATHQGNKVLATIVAALRQASALQDKVRFQGLSFAEIEVELGLPPAIKLSFTEEE